MIKWKQWVSAFSVASIMMTSVFGSMPSTVYADDNLGTATQIGEVIRLQPGNASPFNDTNGDGFGEFQGWGTSLCWWANRLGYSTQMTEEAAKVFFSDEGLDMNIGRYNIGGGDNVYKDDSEKDGSDFQHAFHITRSDSVVPGYCVNVTKIDTTQGDADYYINTLNFDQADDNCGYAWNYDWTADINQVNIMNAAKAASGDEFIAEAFSNSPPYFMTNSGCSSGNTQPGVDNLRADSYQAFAKYMADVIAHFSAATEDTLNIDFQSTTPMNEPYTDYWKAYSWKQEGCHFDQGDSQSKIIVALNEELQERGIDIIISASDETSIDTAITSYQKLSDAAKNIVTRIDTHTYDGSNRDGLSTTAEKAGMNLWMSEVDGAYTGGTDSGEMSAALGLGQRIITDVTGLRSSAWILWNAVDMHVDADNEFDSDSIEELSYDSNKGYWGIAIGDHNNKKIVLTKKYYGYGQFTRYIRPGYSIIGSTGTSLAAYDPDSKKAVIVAMNTSDEDRTDKFNLKSFVSMGSNIKAIRTSGSLEDGENWADVSATDDIVVDSDNRCFTATLKANSITTYIVDNVIYDAVYDVAPVVRELSLTKDMVTGSAAWNNGTTDVATNVVDGDFSTFFDGVSNGYVIIDLGKSEDIAAVAYAPRTSYADRCVGASFYGSNDGTNWTKLYTIGATPAQNTYTYAYAEDFISNDLNFRYIKYAVPEGDSSACCNISEIKVFRAVKSLSQEIAYYKALTEGREYNASTKEVFDNALAEAQKLVDESSEDEAEIAKAIQNLEDAYNALAEIYTYDSISGVDGARIFDNNGIQIQAHGGQVQQLTVDGKTKWYWIGEDKTNDYRPCAGIHMYSSEDLYNWTDEGLVLKTMTNIEQFETDPYFSALYGDLSEEEQKAIYVDLWQGSSDAGCVIERPKMLYNETTGKYVIWFHADGNDPFATGSGSNYAKGKAGIAIADSPTGPYKLLGSYLLDSDYDNHGFDTVGGHVRDMNLFKDDDGTAYVLYSSEGNAVMYIAKLNDEYTGLAVDPENAELGKDFAIISTDSREAPAMFKYKGMYYLITSGCTGWYPNQARYAVAESPLGPWTNMGDPCTDTGSGTTYDTQSTCVIPVDPENGKFIYMGDRWMNPDIGGSLRDSRYVWIPVEFMSDNKIALRRYSDWKLDVLDNMSAYELKTELPKTVSSIAELEEALPSKVSVLMDGAAEEQELSVEWSGIPTESYFVGPATITGTLESGRTFTFDVDVVDSRMIYFFDAGADESAYYDTAKEILGTKLRNNYPDQDYTASTHAGNAGVFEVDYGKKSTGTDIWSQGIWAEGGKNITYSFDLEAGSYVVATGYHEWWNTSRATKITVKGDNNTVLGSTSFTLASTDTKLQQDVAFELTDPQTVTVSISKTGNPDPVLSWIAMFQTAQTGELADKTELSTTIDSVDALNPADYIAADWAKLQQILKDATITLGDVRVDQTTVDAQNIALQNAINSLTTIHKALENGITAYTVPASTAGNYTGASWSIYTNIINDVKELLNKEDLTEIELNAALLDLADAKSILEPNKKATASASDSQTVTAPKKASLKSVAVKTGKKLLVKWTKDSTVNGYEVQYCLKKDFKSGIKTKTVSKNATTSITLSGLKKGKVYYVRVRSYKNVTSNGKTTKLYGPWSSVKKSKKVK